MKKLSSLFLLLIVLALSGCSWQRIPAAPEYTHETPIPLRVGIILGGEGGKASSISHPHYYERTVISEWNEMQLFDSLVYPYREDDPVDAIMRLTITGDWELEGQLRSFGVEMLTILTYGLTSPLVGRSITGTHNAIALINQSLNEIGQYSVQVTSTIDVGIGALSQQGTLLVPSSIRKYIDNHAEGNDLQIKRIAFELAKKIRADRQNLLSKFDTSQEGATVP